MLNVTLNDKTAKLLESYRRTKRLSREKALERLLEEVTQRQAMQDTLMKNWARNTVNTSSHQDSFEADLNEIIKRDRVKQRVRGAD